MLLLLAPQGCSKGQNLILVSDYEYDVILARSKSFMQYHLSASGFTKIGVAKSMHNDYDYFVWNEKGEKIGHILITDKMVADGKVKDEEISIIRVGPRTVKP